ncbi:MAG: hypothetical protein ACK521_06675 [bacterium]
MNDPITGVINEDIVLKSNRRIESNHLMHLHEDKMNKIKIKKKKINKKYGLEEDDSKNELGKLKECKQLLNKMSVILKRNEAYKPSLVQKIRNFKITFDPVKMKRVHEAEETPLSAHFKH